ncbi:MAG: agmatinase [Candidatus Thermoplasmatota archaeon]|jgi:agmatinase|nr:agmatinase [Candidatus Thermoplasmatota archaeon]
MPSPLKFCDSSDSYEDSKYVIFGVPFDSTVSFRSGEKFAPNEIRKASYNMESYAVYRGIDLKNSGIFDMGDIEEYHRSDEMIEEVYSVVDRIVSDRKFPIMMGGEHSVSNGAIKRIKGKVIFIDAHTDYRDSYLGDRNSHACVARRAAEVVGKENVVSIGPRSISKEEMDDGPQKYFTSFEVNEDKTRLKAFLKGFCNSPVYLSIDFDGFDPAYAPGVGTPEPFGLNPMILMDILETTGGNLVGLDVNEITPTFDNGNTSMLAARIIQEVVSYLETSRK